MATLLLTSFDTWLPHQNVNSSDQVLLLLKAHNLLPIGCEVIHRLPVAVEPAFAQILAAIEHHNPPTIVCFGMAESREVLSLERYARGDDRCLETSLDLVTLCQALSLQLTEISDDAGDFVCNGLYYVLLRFLEEARRKPLSVVESEALAAIKHQNGCFQGLFIHVPRINENNQAAIVSDLHQILQGLCQPERFQKSA